MRGTTIMGTPESAATTANTKLTEAQALDWLAANPNTGNTVREIAAIWGRPISPPTRPPARAGQ
jgi:hypothetical protein